MRALRGRRFRVKATLLSENRLDELRGGFGLDGRAGKQCIERVRVLTDFRNRLFPIRTRLHRLNLLVIDGGELLLDLFLLFRGEHDPRGYAAERPAGLARERFLCGREHALSEELDARRSLHEAR